MLILTVNASVDAAPAGADGRSELEATLPGAFGERLHAPLESKAAAVEHDLGNAGLADVLAKSLGSDNPINVVHATVAGLKDLHDPERVASLRDLELDEMLPKKMVENLTAGSPHD